MNKQQSLAFTFYTLLAVAVMVVVFTCTIKIMDHNDEISNCRLNMVGFSELERKAECRR
jgi:hypothetical protein